MWTGYFWFSINRYNPACAVCRFDDALAKLTATIWRIDNEARLFSAQRFGIKKGVVKLLLSFNLMFVTAPHILAGQRIFDFLTMWPMTVNSDSLHGKDKTHKRFETFNA